MSLSTVSLGETVKERGLLRKSIVIMLLVTLLLNLVPVLITAQFDPLRIIQHAAFAFFMVSALSFYALVLAHVSGDVELRVKDDGQGFRFEESIDGEVADDVVGELFDLARRTLGLQGEVTEALGTMEWKGQDSLGWNYVTVARRGGRTTIGVLSTRSDAAVLAVTVSGVGTLLGSVGLAGALVAATSLAAPIAVAAPVGVVAGIGLATGGVWAAMRATWSRYARRTVSRVETLGSALVAAARHAIEEGRVR